MALSLVTGSSQDNSCDTLTPLYPDLTDDYLWEKEEPGEAILRAVAGTIDQPNRIRFATASIANLFTGQTAVTPSAGQSTAGISILTQVQEVWKIYDAADADVAPLFFPVSAHMVIKVPTNGLVTSSVLENLVLRLIGAPFRNGTDSLGDAMNPLLFGITKIE